MSRDYRVYLEDILEAARRIREYTTGIDVSSFAADFKTQDAVLRNLEIIGEAARVLPEQVSSLRKDVDWKKISGLRNILIHEYFGVDLEIIWDIVQNKVPELQEAVGDILKTLGG